MIELTDNNVDILCKLTIQQAAHDLIEGICKKKESVISDCKRFFNSEYYSSMTKIDGNYIIKMCYEIAEEANYDFNNIPPNYKKLI